MTPSFTGDVNMARKPNRPKEVIAAERAANEAKRIAKLEARIAKLKREAVEKERRASQKAANAEKARVEAARIAANKVERANNKKRDRTVVFYVYEDAITGLIRRHNEGLVGTREKNMYARILGRQLAHELQSRYIGKISVVALQMGWEAFKKGEKYNPTAEHFNPSQVMGHKMVNTFLALGYFDVGVMNELLDEALQTNKTTAQENMKLREEQKHGKFVSADVAYAKCGIVLVDWPDGSNFADAAKMYPQYCC